jgi:hypothetical protein
MTRKRKALEGYEQLGDPDEPYELTKRDERRQQQSESIREAVRRMHNHRVVGEDGHEHWMSHSHDDDDLGHTHPPELRYPRRADGGYTQPETGPANRDPIRLSDEAVEHVASIFRRSHAQIEKHPEDLVVWRLRLYCGHVIERTSHHTHTRLSSAFTGGSTRCTECGKDPSTILAAKALGRQEPLAGTPKPRKAAAKRPTVAEQNAQLRRENADLRRQLADRSTAATNEELS